MTDTLKVVDAEALHAAFWRWVIGQQSGLKKPRPTSHDDWEEILADITTDDLSPAHRARIQQGKDTGPTDWSLFD